MIMPKRMQVAVKDLQVGQYVVLPPPWSRHPFLLNHFLLRSPRDAARLREAGITQVEVDLEKSRVQVAPVPRELAPAALFRNDEPCVEAPEPLPPAEWNPRELVTEEFHELIHDTQLPVPVKARLLHHAAVDMMTELMRRPSLERMQEFKSGLALMVDQVLRDDALAGGLLRITAHDVYTWTHSINVGVYSLLLARSLYRNSDAHDLHELAAGFFLHDIGKSEIDPALLNKRGRFTAEERREMSTHVAQGERLVAETHCLSPEARLIVGQHHERVDGQGYPRGLSGGEIHPYGLICGLADVYDALTSVRPYKVSLSPFEALRTIRHELVNSQNLATFEHFVRLLYD